MCDGVATAALQALLAADDAAAAARRAGRQAGEYAHITQDMLKDGGYFDMPIQVRMSSIRPFRLASGPRCFAVLPFTSGGMCATSSTCNSWALA
jgi:hypothetical protein